MTKPAPTVTPPTKPWPTSLSTLHIHEPASRGNVGGSSIPGRAPTVQRSAPVADLL